MENTLKERIAALGPRPWFWQRRKRKEWRQAVMALLNEEILLGMARMAALIQESGIVRAHPRTMAAIRLVRDEEAN